MLKLFLGWDKRETVAWHVLAHSIIRRASIPVSITPIGNDTLSKDIWWRPRGPHDSTDFANARFLVPYLCNYEGTAIFMDCDMLCLTDISGLINEQGDDAVMVRKHQYIPESSTKFLGQPQTRYARKNWSSLMVFNCAHPDCRELSLDYVNNSPGLDLHQFAWTNNIGSISDGWNHLVKHDECKEAVA